MPPLWALARHMTAGGANSLSSLKVMVQEFDNWEYPLEGLWLDYQSLDSYNDFRTNQYDYDGLLEYS